MTCPHCGKEMRKVYRVIQLKETLYKCDYEGGCGHRELVKEETDGKSIK